MQINSRVDDAKAKVARRIALDSDHAGWPEILDRAIDLYIDHYRPRAPERPAAPNNGSGGNPAALDTE